MGSMTFFFVGFDLLDYFFLSIKEEFPYGFNKSILSSSTLSIVLISYDFF